MLISHKHRCIFAHVPKCAGTSIKQTLELDFVDPPNWHCTWSDARRILGDQVLESYFRFTVIRNPWDRVISAWKMFEQKPWCKQKKPHTLQSFLEVVTDESLGYKARYGSKKEQDLWMKTPENIRHHTLPCLHPYYGLVDESGAMKMNLVIPYKMLSDGFERVCRRLRIDEISLPQSNRTEHEHYSHYFDAGTQEMVARYFAGDIKLFKFTFVNK